VEVVHDRGGDRHPAQRQPRRRFHPLRLDLRRLVRPASRRQWIERLPRSTRPDNINASAATPRNADPSAAAPSADHPRDRFPDVCAAVKHLCATNNDRTAATNHGDQDATRNQLRATDELLQAADDHPPEARPIRGRRIDRYAVAKATSIRQQGAGAHGAGAEAALKIARNRLQDNGFSLQGRFCHQASHRDTDSARRNRWRDVDQAAVGLFATLPEAGSPSSSCRRAPCSDC
jgi:hypothetical protein